MCLEPVHHFLHYTCTSRLKKVMSGLFALSENEENVSFMIMSIYLLYCTWNLSCHRAAFHSNLNLFQCSTFLARFLPAFRYFLKSALQSRLEFYFQCFTLTAISHLARRCCLDSAVWDTNKRVQRTWERSLTSSRWNMLVVTAACIAMRCHKRAILSSLDSNMRSGFRSLRSVSLFVVLAVENWMACIEFLLVVRKLIRNERRNKWCEFVSESLSRSKKPHHDEERIGKFVKLKPGDMLGDDA